MAPELSSNWKKLQAKIKEENQTPPVKRKAPEALGEKTRNVPHKRQRTDRSEAARRPAVRQRRTGESKPSGTQRQIMGAAQSSTITKVGKTPISPSLALWAADNDISPEDIAQAYGLGIKSNSLLSASASRPNEGLARDVDVGKYVAVDCEMVGVGPDGYDAALARVSVVDFHGRQVYDSFVKPRERVTDWRTHVSGVSPKDMATARGFEEDQEQVAELHKGRILVGHDVRHDLLALLLEHPLKLIRDTARYSGFKKYGHGPKPALRVLAREILGVEIQKGQHSSIEDARVAMLLFRKFKSDFDVQHAARFPDIAEQQPKANSRTDKPKPKKKKKKRQKI